jgi:hypothetical protein
MVAAMGAFALPAGAAPSTPSQVYVVHGILGVPVDVYVNGNKLLSDFQPKDVVGPLELPPATYTITLKQPGTNTDIFSDDVAVPSGQNLTLIAGVSGTGGGAGTPAYFVLPNDASGIVVGKSRVGVFHAANAPQVDIQLDGSDSGITLDNGESGVADVPVGTYSVGVQVAPSGPVAIGPVDLTFGARTLAST